MVSKLVFKGDQPKKKKSKGIRKSDSVTRRVKRDEVEPNDDDPVWTNARNATDLVGPIVLAMVCPLAY